MNLEPIYTFFDLENYRPQYNKDLEACKGLLAYVEKEGYEVTKRNTDKCVIQFRKNNVLIVGNGDTEAEAITTAFFSYMASLRKRRNDSNK